MVNWNKIKKYFPIIGIIIFVYLLIKLDIRQIFSEIYKLNLFYVLVGIVILVIYFLFQTLKWWLIARKQKIMVPFLKAFKINIITIFYGFVTPSKLGAVMRAEYLKRYANIGKGISNFVIDKILDLSSLFLMAIIFSFIFRDKFYFIPIYLWVLIFGIFILISLIMMKKNWAVFCFGFSKRFIPKGMKEKLKITFDDFYEDAPNKKFILFVFLINLFTWILLYTFNYFIGLSLGINLAFIYFLAIFPISTLVAQIPISISGLGTREITLIGLFGFFGISSVKVFSMSILSLVISSIIPSIIAIFLILKTNPNK